MRSTPTEWARSTVLTVGGTAHGPSWATGRHHKPSLMVTRTPSWHRSKVLHHRSFEDVEKLRTDPAALDRLNRKTEELLARRR